MKGVHKGFGIRARLPVVQTQKQIYRSNPIDRTHQFKLLIPRQISEMNSPKFSKRDVCSHGLWIFRIVLAWLEVHTIRVRFACARQRRRDISCRRNDSYVESGDRNFVAGLRDGVFGVGIKLWIDIFQKVVHSVRRLNVGTMVDEFLDSDVRRQLLQPPKMISVPVGNDEVIDPLHAGIFHCSHDAPGVAWRRSADVAGIDQQ